MKRLWIALAKLFGWHFEMPDDATLERLRHCVIIMAPHTSIYDFLLGAAAIWEMNLNGRFFIKKEFFKFPIKGFLRKCGALPIDRGNRGNHIVDSAVAALRENREMTIIITPEGTRKPVRRFKRGFYEIALQADVPIALTYINFKTRRMGVGPIMTPTGDFNSDMRKILAYYGDAHPRNQSGWDYAKLKTTYMSENSPVTKQDK